MIFFCANVVITFCLEQQQQQPRTRLFDDSLAAQKNENEFDFVFDSSLVWQCSVSLPTDTEFEFSAVDGRQTLTNTQQHQTNFIFYFGEGGRKCWKFLLFSSEETHNSNKRRVRDVLNLIIGSYISCVWMWNKYFMSSLSLIYGLLAFSPVDQASEWDVWREALEVNEMWMSSDHNQAAKEVEKKTSTDARRLKRSGAKSIGEKQQHKTWRRWKRKRRKIPRTSSRFYRKNENLIALPACFFGLKVGYNKFFFYSSSSPLFCGAELANENQHEKSQESPGPTKHTAELAYISKAIWVSRGKQTLKSRERVHSRYETTTRDV